MGDGFVRTDRYRKKVFLGYWIVFAELREGYANRFARGLGAPSLLQLVWDGRPRREAGTAQSCR
jgi:hypothetical protein